MPTFDSLEELKEALNRYKENDDYSYTNVCEDYGIGNRSTVSTWFKPVMDGEKTPEEVWNEKTTRGRKKKSKTEEKEDETQEKTGEDSGHEREGKIYMIILIAGIVMFVIYLLTL